MRSGLSLSSSHTILAVVGSARTRRDAKIRRYRRGFAVIMWTERVGFVGFIAVAIFMAIGIFVIDGVGNRVFFGAMAALCVLGAYIARWGMRKGRKGIDDSTRLLGELKR